MLSKLSFCRMVTCHRCNSLSHQWEHEQQQLTENEQHCPSVNRKRHNFSALQLRVSESISCTILSFKGPGKLNMIGFLNTSDMVAAAKRILALLRVRQCDSYWFSWPQHNNPHRAHKAAANLSEFKSEMGDEVREAAAQSAEKPITFKASRRAIFFAALWVSGPNNWCWKLQNGEVITMTNAWIH